VPELPEVETIRRGLELGIVGQRVAAVEVLNSKSFAAGFEDIRACLVGHKVTHCARQAKVLMLELDSGYSLLFHLKMTGQLVLVKVDGERFAGGHPTDSMAASLPDKSTRLWIQFESGDTLFFNDQRKFGWVKLIPTDEIKDDVLVRRLGPEPLTEAFTLDGFKSVIRRRGRSPIKAIILDQSSVSGVGNIYADESLHLAKIHPSRPGSTLSDAEAKRLWQAIREVIALGIEHGGTSFTNYVNALGQTGDYLEYARVFRRQGQPCLVCGTPIEKLRVIGRGTHICPGCQVEAQL
jgi:formamidopyrimidine-DNA glycosylase